MMRNKKGEFKYDQSILLTSSLMRSSLLPQSPPLWIGCLLEWNPPLGGVNLKGHKKLLASLKLAPTVSISLIKSSMQMILCFCPKAPWMMLLEERGILCPCTFPKPLFKMSRLMVVLEGYLNKLFPTRM